MTKEINLSIAKRDEKEGIKKIISEGYIPAVLYGPGTAPASLKVKEVDFGKVFALAGESQLINLAIDNGQAVKALVKDTQKDVIKNKIIHIDFYQVDMSKKITAMIPLRFVGESRAVKELGATLVKSMDEIEVECLPGNLIDKLEIDLAALKEFDDAIRINQIKLPSGMELTADTDEVVISALPPLKEEVEAPVAAVAVAEEAAPAEVKTEEKKEEKKEKNK